MSEHNYKLRYSQVIGIKEQLANTKTGMNKIAQTFSVSLDTVRQINQGKTHSEIGSFSYPIRQKKYLPIHDYEKRPVKKKLSDDQAFEVMMRLEMGESPYQIAKDYDVSHEVIRNVADRPMFRHMNMFDDDY
jgi:hypothetical protein